MTAPAPDVWRHLPAFPLAIANERSVVPDGPLPAKSHAAVAAEISRARVFRILAEQTGQAQMEPQVVRPA